LEAFALKAWVSGCCPVRKDIKYGTRTYNARSKTVA